MGLLCNGSASSANTTGLMAACIGPPALGIAYVQGGTPVYGTASSTVAYTFASAQNAGDAILVFVSGNPATGTPSSVADTAGNTYTLITNTNSGNFAVYAALNIVASTAGSNVVTATLSGAATFSCMCAIEYQPSTGNVLSIVDQNFTGAVGTTSGSSTTWSPQYCCEIGVNCVAGNNILTSPTGEAGWNTRGTSSNLTNQSMIIQDQIQTIRANLTITTTNDGGASPSWASLTVGLAINAAPPTSSGTICAFVYVAAAPSGGPTVTQLALPGAGDGDGYLIGLTSTPGIQCINCNGTNPTAKTILVKQWYFLSMRVSAASVSQTSCAVMSGSDLVAATVTAGEAAYTPSAFAVGIDLLLSGNGGAALNAQGELTGSIAGLKVWTNGAWLSDAELLAESMTLAPVRKADLWGSWKFQGEGNNMSLLAEDGMVAGLLLAKLGTNQVSFAPDPPIPRVPPYYDRGLKKSSNLAVALAVAIVGQATVVDAINVARKLADAIVGGATIAQALVVARKFSLSIGGTALLTDRLAVARTLKDATSGQASMGDTMTVKRALAEAVGAHASVTEAVNVARSLLEAIHGTSAYAATSVIARAMVVAIHGAATETAAITVVKSLSLAAIGRASDTFAFNRIISFALPVGGRASAALSLHATRPLALGTGGHAAASLAVLMARPLALSSVGLSTLTAALDVNNTGAVSLAVAIAGQAVMTDAMRVARHLTAPLSGQALLAALASVKRPIAFAAHGQGSEVVSLGRLKTLILGVDGVGSAAFVNKVVRGMSLPVIGRASSSASFTRRLAVAVAMTPHAVVTPSLVRSLEITFGIAGSADLIANIFIGNGPMGPLRIAAANLAIVSWLATDAPLVVITANDEAIIPVVPVDALPIVIVASDGAIVTITPSDGPPT